MDSVRYYKDVFGNDLVNVASAPTAAITDRISIVSLIPSKKYPGLFGETAKAFQQLEHKILFLFCYYFSSLLDQAFHSALREEHDYFDRIAGYPKLCGILGSYWSNLHPSLLLLVATLYTKDQDKLVFTENLDELAEFFPGYYYEFVTQQYPRLTGRLSAPERQREAASRLFNELSNAVAILFQPHTLRPYSALPPDEVLFKSWMATIAKNTNRVLRTIA